MTKFLLWLKAKLNKRSEIGHALLSLVMFWPIALVGIFFLTNPHAYWCVGLAATLSLGIYFGREERDAEIELLEQAKDAGKPTTVWLIWIPAIRKSIFTKDFAYPFAAIITSCLVAAYTIFKFS